MEPVSDGCTGFWWLEQWFSINQCCRVHDFGGSDAALLECLLQNVPLPLWPFVMLCVGLMIVLRPIYHRFKPQITAFYEAHIKPNIRRR